MQYLLGVSQAPVEFENWLRSNTAVSGGQSTDARRMFTGAKYNKHLVSWDFSDITTELTSVAGIRCIKIRYKAMPMVISRLVS